MKYAMIGAAGYIAPRHLKAIKETGGTLVAAYDITDSVGILDSYFPSCEFFTDEFEFYNRLLDDLRVDFMVICSPNHLHYDHCRNALKLGSDIICEKPLVMNIAELNELKELQELTSKKIYTILQLRLHPKLTELKMSIESSNAATNNAVIEYFTPRGKWYHSSWKGDDKRSGGIATNIGIHLFDLCGWLFGELHELSVERNTNTESIGVLKLQQAEVRWHLSIATDAGSRRSISVNGETIEFTEGFSDLHTKSYQEILANKGFTIDDVRTSIQIVEKIRG